MRELTFRIHGSFRIAAVAALIAASAGCDSKKASTSGTPTPTGWTISGTVSGATSAGVTVSVLGGTYRAMTNSLGKYTIAGVPDGTYTLEPSLAGFNFTPPTRTVTVSGAAVTDQNFTAAAGLAITGKVTGDSPQGVTLTLVGPEPATSTVTASTGADGGYRFPNVTAGVYRLTPSRASGWTFSPANVLVTVVAASLNGPDFVATAPTHRLAGAVTGAISAGLTVTLSGDADAVAVTTTSGGFVFTGLAPGNYVVTPSYPGYAFSPTSVSTTVSTADVGEVNFTSAATHRISGRISGDVLGGVALALSGAGTGATTSDASGYFEFPGLANGAYVVTPALDGYTFGPTDSAVTLSGADAATATFTATASPLFRISGAVSGAVKAGVTLTLAGDPTAVATTDTNGAFKFDRVAPGSYLLTPSKDDYLFDPASQFIVVSTASVTTRTFTATVDPTARTVSGTVGGAVSAGVTVTLVGPSPDTTARTAITDASGSYAFRSLADGLYLATPSLPGLAFTPASCLVRVAGPSVTFVPFTAAVAPHSISGTVSGTGTDGAGVGMLLTGFATAVATTDVAGNYTFTGLADGEYKVTPRRTGSFLTPMERSVTVTGANVAGVNFVIALTHRISGVVSGDAGPGVTVRLGGMLDVETVTSTDGSYTFLDLRDGGYVVTPTLAGYVFEPQLVQTDVAGADVTAHFTATRVPTYQVTGTIDGAMPARVLLTLSGPAIATQRVLSTDAGTYTFSGLPNGSYMVVPSSTGYTFTPAASRAFRIDGANVSGQDFTSVAAP